jgi:hypothetical protein
MGNGHRWLELTSTKDNGKSTENTAARLRSEATSQGRGAMPARFKSLPSLSLTGRRCENAARSGDRPQLPGNRVRLMPPPVESPASRPVVGHNVRVLTKTVTDFAPFARYDRQPRIPAAGSNACGRISAGDGSVTPLGLDAPALHNVLDNALHHYRDRIQTLMHALEREGAVRRFSSHVPRILEELVTTVEVDATARDLPERTRADVAARTPRARPPSESTSARAWPVPA